jgi:hypothetical protein
VTRGVDIDEPVRVVIDQRLELRELVRAEQSVKQARDVADIGESFGILQAGPHVVVARDHPTVPLLRPLHRVFVLQQSVNRERIGGETGRVDDIIQFHV